MDEIAEVTEVTVLLTERSVKALELAVGLTGDTRTDTINRAVQAYAFFEDVFFSGGLVYTRKSEGADLVQVEFL